MPNTRRTWPSAAETFLNPLAAVADLLHGLLHRRGRAASLLCFVSHFVGLAFSHAGAILFTPPCRLLLRCHLLLRLRNYGNATLQGIAGFPQRSCCGPKPNERRQHLGFTLVGVSISFARPAARRLRRSA